MSAITKVPSLDEVKKKKAEFEEQREEIKSLLEQMIKISGDMEKVMEKLSPELKKMSSKNFQKDIRILAFSLDSVAQDVRLLHKLVGFLCGLVQFTSEQAFLYPNAVYVNLEKKLSPEQAKDEFQTFKETYGEALEILKNAVQNEKTRLKEGNGELYG